MKLRLKEDPREWRKFAWSTCGVLGFIALILAWREVVSWETWKGVAVVMALMAVAAFWWPTLFRRPYRVGMTASYFLGRVMGRLTLGILFTLMVVPLGILLRCLGVDPLGLKKNADAGSYWRTKKSYSDLDRAF